MNTPKNTELNKIYLISRTDDWSWDEYESFVVVSTSPEEAKLVPTNWGDWKFKAKDVKAKFIGYTKLKAGTIILGSFNAG